MGYQVERICYQTEAEATNVLMTQVVPVIDKDGVLHHPVYNGSAWMYQGQIVQPTFPQCEYGLYSRYGQEIGNGLVMVFVALLVVVISVRAVSLAGEKLE